MVWTALSALPFDWLSLALECSTMMDSFRTLFMPFTRSMIAASWSHLTRIGPSKPTSEMSWTSLLATCSTYPFVGTTYAL